MRFIKNTQRYFRKRAKKFIVLTKHFYQRLFLNDVVAFEEQMLDKVPKDSYDESVDFIITDQEIYKKNS